MPWKLVKDGDQTCVHKENADGTAGEKLKCYDNEADAKAYMRALYAHMPEAEKSINLQDRQNKIQSAVRDILDPLFPHENQVPQSVSDSKIWIRDIFDDYVVFVADNKTYRIDYVADEEGNLTSVGDKIVEVKQEWSPAVKAVGNWELEIRAVPFGNEHDTDSDGQWFDKDTDFMLDTFKTFPIVYYHGYNPEGGVQENPEIVGLPTSVEVRADGIYVKAILDKTKALAKRIWEAAKRGLAFASSGSILHLARLEDKRTGKLVSYDKSKPGRIAKWALAELSLFDGGGGRRPANAHAYATPVMKSLYKQAGINYPLEGAKMKVKSLVNGVETEVEIDEEVYRAAELAVKAKTDADAATALVEVNQKAAIDAAIEAEKVKWAAEAAKGHRLPFMETVNIAKTPELWKYDGLDAADQALMLAVLKEANKPFHPAALKALAVKLEEDKTEVGQYGQSAMKMAGIKANEIDYSTYGSYGDEWVGIAYATALWEAIRVGTFVVDKLPKVEVPQGMESIYLPLESTDPVWYKVAQATAVDSNLKVPAATVTNSPFGTGRVQLTLAKLGARVIWTGELAEDSLIPFAGQLRTQLAKSGAEYLESAIIDGDNETSANLNINDIAGTPGTTDWFMVWDGFRKSPLITTVANARSAAGSLDVDDYLETLKLMGSSGINALDRNAVEFIVDPATYWKTLALPEVKTRDSFASPTLENGVLTGLWGYGLKVSGSMHKASAVRKANTAGKVDVDVTTNNAYGAILAVRYDQWKFGWRRRMTIETTRIPNADSTEIVAMLRCGLIQRDTEAAALTYYVGV